MNEKETILEKSLEDPNWEVRLEAGKGLLNLGEEGKAILRRQEGSINPLSYDIARFLLTAQV